MFSSLVGPLVMPFLPASELPSGHFLTDSGTALRDNDGPVPGQYAILPALSPRNAIPTPGSYDDIAREFGLDEDLIRELAQRLNMPR